MNTEPQRLNKMENHYSTETLTVLVKESDKKISKVDNRLQSVEKKVDIKFDSMNSKFDSMSLKIDLHSNKLDDLIYKLTDKANKNEKDIAVISAKTNDQLDDIKELKENSKKYNEAHKKYEISKAAIKKIITVIGLLGGLATIITAII